MVSATCHWGHWDPLLGFLVSSIREFEDDSERRLKTILLAFERTPQARKAVNFGSCSEEGGKEPPVSHGGSARSHMAKGGSALEQEGKGPKSRESDLRLSEPLRQREERGKLSVSVQKATDLPELQTSQELCREQDPGREKQVISSR